MISEIELPKKLKPLFEPKRYKVIHGGRGSGKSHGVARALLILGAQKPLRILCAREFQNSIADSVHKLLSDLIHEYNLNGFYNIQKSTIIGENGTEFIFEGIRHNIQSIKSKEKIDICWIEEAQTVSKASWEVLTPTIRADDSEIWTTFNPELETDETYQRFIIDPPKEALVIEMNWKDNPWFPDVLEIERQELKEKDMDSYLHVWEGRCRQALAGAIYEKQLQAADLEGRITKVPYDQTIPVHTYWDIGRSDLTTIWFVQRAGFEFHIIDYYENNEQDELAFYVNELNGKGYTYGVDWLPHDAKAKRLGTKFSVVEQLRALGRDVRVAPNIPRYDGIMAARAIFNRCYFDKEKCTDGLNALRHYSYGVNAETGERTKEPIHNWASHAADAWRYFAVNSRKTEPKQKRMPKKVIKRGYGRV